MNPIPIRLGIADGTFYQRGVSNTYPFYDVDLPVKDVSKMEKLVLKSASIYGKLTSTASKSFGVYYYLHGTKNGEDVSKVLHSYYFAAGSDAYKSSKKTEEEISLSEFDTADYVRLTITWSKSSSYNASEGLRLSSNENFVELEMTTKLYGSSSSGGSSGGGSGQDGFSPTIVENSENTSAVYKLDITTKDGMFTTPNLKGGDGKDGKDGINGQDGKDGIDGKDGANGVDGQDGFSPTIAENEENDSENYRLEITTKDGTFITPNLMGAKGEPGNDAEINSLTYQEAMDILESED